MFVTKSHNYIINVFLYIVISILNKNVRHCVLKIVLKLCVKFIFNQMMA